MSSKNCGPLSTKIFFVASSAVIALSALTPHAVSGETLNERQKNEPSAAKAANIGAARQLNQGQAPADGNQKNSSAATAAAVNKVPGVKVSGQDLQGGEAPPIKGFHPIKKMLQPVENLEGMSIKLEQQIVKLEGPIAALNPPMVSLQGKMTNVNDTMSKMQNQLNGVDGQMHGVRDDLAKMRKEIAELKGPILGIQKPLASVSRPLEAVETQLNMVLLAIVIAAIGIVIGTPMAAILVYRYRDKLFPPQTVTPLPREREPVSR